jgi:hypothetical protein
MKTGYLTAISLFTFLLSFQGIAQTYTFTFINAQTGLPVQDIHVLGYSGVSTDAPTELHYHPKNKVFTYKKTNTVDLPLQLTILPAHYYFPGIPLGETIVLNEQSSTDKKNFTLPVLPTLKINLIKKIGAPIVVGIKVPFANCDSVEKKLYTQEIKNNYEWACDSISDSLSAFSFTMDELNHTLYMAIEHELIIDLFFLNDTVRTKKIKMTSKTKEVTIVIDQDQDTVTIK